jgi:hypothetical protein
MTQLAKTCHRPLPLSGNFAVITGATREGRQTPLLAVAVVLSLIGIFAFFAVLLSLTYRRKWRKRRLSR